MYQGSVTSAIGVILNRHVPHSTPSMPAKPQKVMDGCPSRSVWELKIVPSPSFQTSLARTGHWIEMRAFPVGLWVSSKGAAPTTLPVPAPYVSLPSPHLYHPKQGERLHQEAGKPKSSYIHDIFHVTLENHMTSLFCL